MIYLIIACLVGALLFPVFVNIYLYGDKADGKLGFAFYLFGTFRILSGYAALYTGGIALHLTDKKAILLPYKEILSARKKFEITKGFSVCRYRQVIELGGAQNTAGALAAGLVLRKATDLAFLIVRHRSDVVLEGDILVDINREGMRAAVSAVVAFNLLIVLFAAFKIFLEKIL